MISSLKFQPGDYILCTNITYGAVLNAVDRQCNLTGATLVRLAVVLPLDVDTFLRNVRRSLKTRQGKTKLAVFDLMSSVPSSKFPVRQLCDLCHEFGCEVLIDGAHGIGMVPLDIPSLGCDYFVTNCNKWLCTPKGLSPPCLFL